MFSCCILFDLAFAAFHALYWFVWRILIMASFIFSLMMTRVKVETSCIPVCVLVEDSSSCLHIHLSNQIPSRCIRCWNCYIQQNICYISTNWIRPARTTFQLVKDNKFFCWKTPIFMGKNYQSFVERNEIFCRKSPMNLLFCCPFVECRQRNWLN